MYLFPFDAYQPTGITTLVNIQDEINIKKALQAVYSSLYRKRKNVSIALCETIKLRFWLDKDD